MKVFYKNGESRGNGRVIQRIAKFTEFTLRFEEVHHCIEKSPRTSTHVKNTKVKSQ